MGFASSSVHIRRCRSLPSTLLAVLLASTGCEDDGAPRVPAEVIVFPSFVVVDEIGATEQFTAQVQDGNGDLIAGAAVTWSSSDISVAAVESATGLATARGPGIATITATSAPASGTAGLEVSLFCEQDYVTGQSYYGRNQYIEYIAGDLPLVLSAPHGGYLTPEEIPDRTWGTMAQDRQTQELARAIADSVYVRTGGYAHIIICRVHRSKLDANREIVEAAQGNPHAQQAWYEYHNFIEDAKGTVAEEYERGFYIDLHGHGHEMQWLELGYLLQSSDLELSDAQLERPDYVNKSSIRTLALEADSGFAALVRGPTSLGGLLEQRGYPSVPSPAYVHPGGQPFFSGGYNTARHGSRDGGPISGVQIEANWTGVRDSPGNREAFAGALAEALEVYFDLHFRIDLPGLAPLASVTASGSRGQGFEPDRR